MTKSEMRRLQFQKKYTSNEDYEKDKDLAIAFCESTVIERTPAEIKQMKRIADLLNQSKWAGDVDCNFCLCSHSWQTVKLTSPKRGRPKKEQKGF